MLIIHYTLVSRRRGMMLYASSCAPILSFLIEFIGVTLVCKIIQVSSVQLNETPSSQCIVHPLPQAKYLLIPIPPTLAHLHLPPILFSVWLSPHCCLRLCVIHTHTLYLHTYTHTYIYAHIYTCIYICTHTHINSIYKTHVFDSYSKIID